MYFNGMSHHFLLEILSRFEELSLDLCTIPPQNRMQSSQIKRFYKGFPY